MKYEHFQSLTGLDPALRKTGRPSFAQPGPVPRTSQLLEAQG